MGNKERRLENRYLCADLVRVDWVRDEDDTNTVEAVLEDISSLGVCVQVDEPIPLGVPIAISAHGTTFNGYVSYCVFRDYGYFIGVRLSEEHRWSEEEFAPDHLTNLSDLSLEVARAH